MSSAFLRELARTTAPAEPERWVWVPYDQLRSEHPLLGEPGGTGVVYIETTAKPARRPYHKRKLALVLSAQRHHALETARAGYRVVYHVSDRWYDAALEEVRRKHGLGVIEAMEPAEPEVRRPVAEAAGVRLHPNELFITDRSFYDQVFEGRKTRRLESFYRRARRRTGLLMDGDGPVGGRWNLDADNREPWPGEPKPPRPVGFEPDAVTAEVLGLVERAYPDAFGSLEGFSLPVTAAQARRAADHFFERALRHFGRFEDAMDSRERVLFHSQLSSSLNLGLLDPLELCREAERRHARGSAPLAAAEGFIRQILGWREFVRHVYEEHLGRYRSANALRGDLPLPAWYWGAESGLNCLDVTTAQVRETGYSHHITRLMVLSNLATLLGVHPRELNEWFWVAYVDAYEWVVTPNVLGMGTWADGGILGSKPYVASGRYISKMGRTLCDGCAFDPGATTGEGSCPLNHLYWSFLSRNRERLGNNPRMSLVLGQLDRSSDERLREHHRVARAWRARARDARMDGR